VVVVEDVVVEVVVAAATTVKLAGTLEVPDKVAVILAVPAVTAVANPEEEIVAMAGVSLVQVT
jgi:hypothetical protein